MGNAKGSVKKIVRLITVCLFMAVSMSVLFTGCGGGDSEPVSQGSFVDSPVAGLAYNTPSRKGITDSDGKFSYLDGEMISFSIGDIYLGRTPAKPVITPLDLVGGAKDETNASVTNICRFLQTLDDDGNPDNGILINESVRRGASGVSVNFDTDISAFGNDAQTQQAVSSLTAFTSAGQRPLRNAEPALQHFRHTLGISDNSDSTDSDIAENEDDTPANPESETGSEVAQSETETTEPMTSPEPADNTGNAGNTDTNTGETSTVPDAGTTVPVINSELTDNTSNIGNTDTGNTDENPTVPDAGNTQPADNTGNTGGNATVPDSGNTQPADNTGNTGNTDTGNTGENTTVPDNGNTQPADNTGNSGNTDTGNTGENTTVPDSGNTQPAENTGNTGNDDSGNTQPADNTGNTGGNAIVPDSGNTQPADNTGNTGNTGENTTVPDSENTQPADNSGNSGNTDTGNTGENTTVPDSGNTQPADNSGNTGNTDTGNTGGNTTVPDSGNTQPADNTGNTDTGNTGGNTTVPDSGNTQPADNTGNTDTGNTDENTTVSDSGNTQPADNTGNTGNTDTGNTGGNATVPDSGNTQPADNTGNTGNTDTGNTGENTTVPDNGNTQPADNTGNTDTGNDTQTDDTANADTDKDGVTPALGDCNDADANIHPNAEEICGDTVDQNCDGKDAECPTGENARLRISVVTDSGENGISEIWLDIQQVLACGQGGCQVVGGKNVINLLDAENSAITLADMALSERKITHLSFVLGADNRIVVNGESHALKIPPGEQSGLKVLWDKDIAAGKLTEILLAFDWKEAVVLTGEGYMLHPVLRTVSQASAAVEAQTAVVSAKKGGKFRKGEKLEIEVPDGAVEDFSILWGTEAEGSGVTPVFTMGPEGTVFKKPVKVKLSYDPAKIPEGVSENNLVILHDGEAIATVVDAEANTLEGEIAHFSSVQGSVSENSADSSSGSQGTWPVLLCYTETCMIQDVPADVQPGQRVTVIWGLKNVKGPDASGFKLRPNNPADGAGASFPTFSIPAGSTGSARVDNLLIPSVPVPYMSFKILDASGNPLPTVIQDLNIGSGGPGTIPCTVPPCPPVPCIAPEPTVDGAVQWNNGQGSAYTEVKVSNTVGDPGFELNGESQDVTPNGSSYVTQGNPEDGQENEHRITVQGECDLSAYMEYLYYTNRSAYFGFVEKLQSCSGSQGFIGDPVNPAIGNFVQQDTDAIIAGLGGTDIHLERTYNSQALLWTPASLRNYLPDGSYEVIAEPPQYFGKGWSSVFGEFLLEVDYGPLYKGVQILYSDGHTANFKKDGDEYVADSPGNHDLVVKEGDEYVLYQNGCKCSQDSRRFNSDGKLTAISDKNGNEIKLIYAGSMLAAVENASGRRIEFEMNGKGRITKATLPEGITLSYEYENDMLTAFTNGRGLRTVYKYDDKGQMTEIVSPKGHPLVRNAYDEEYRVSEQTVGEKEKYTFAYEKELTRVNDAYGHTTVHHYDENLRLVQIDHPDGNTEYFEYDENNNRTEYRDQSGAEWKWTYDENGNRLTADGPLGWHREWEYNDKNQVVRMTEKVDAATVRSTNFEYDSKGNLIRFCNPLGACGSVKYDSLGQPMELTDFAGNATIHAYDAEGDLISVTDAVQAMTRFSHDGLGRTVSMTKPEGSAFSYVYDKNSNLTDVNGPLDWHISFVFDENDRLTQKTDPNKGNITYEYNASDRPVKMRNQLNFDSASYAYGLMNEITGITDAEGRLWSYAYDELLRVTQVSGPLDTHFYYAYNPVGKITDMTDANGIVTHTDYDALYRPLSVIRNYRAGFAPNADTNVTMSFDYNLIGSVLQTTDPEGYVTKFVYDLMGRGTKKTNAEGYEWVYSFDPMGNLTKVLNPRGFDSLYAYTPVYQLEKAVNPEGHAVSYQYDLDGRLTDKSDPMNIVTHFEYDDLGRLVQKVRNYLPGHAGDSETNVTTAYAYDLAGNLRFLTNPLNHQAEFVYDAAHRRTDFSDFEKGLFRFAYDKVNNLLSVTDAENNPTVYVYDALNRLISMTNAENETRRYAYDKMGNRTHLTEADGTVTLYGYDFIYRLNSVTQNFREGVNPGNDVNALTRYAYDARGLLTQIVNANYAATSFAFDKVGNMIQETDPIGNVWDYEYDGVGNRVVRTDAKRDRTEYAYYPDDMLEEIRYANDQSVQYMYDANNNRTEMKDWLGNTAWEYDPLNRITAQNDPFSRAMAYAYDAASNRTAVTYPDGNMVNYDYSPNNWMKSVTEIPLSPPLGKAGLLSSHNFQKFFDIARKKD